MEILHTTPVDEQGEIERHLDRLPEDLVDIIADQVLADQPFSRVRSLCMSMNERWSDFLLAKQYLLYFDMGQLLLFSSSRRAWETVPLDFIPLEGRRLSNCLASDGGLLLLVTQCGEFFVCNPLIRRFKRLQKPRQGLIEDSLISELCTGVRVYCFTRVVADMVANPHTGRFKVVLSTIDLDSRRSTLVYDSRAEHWRVIEDFGVGTICTFSAPRAKYEGDLYEAGHSAHSATVHVLKYDVEQEQWRSTGVALKSENSVPQIILKINGTLLMGFLGGAPLVFFEVQDTGTSLTLLPSTFGLPVARVCEELRRRTPVWSEPWLLMYVGGEDVVYYVGVVRTRVSQTIRVLVWKHNFVDGSDLLSDWEEWRPLAGSIFPRSEKFHIFKPSFLRIS